MIAAVDGRVMKAHDVRTHRQLGLVTFTPRKTTVGLRGMPRTVPGTLVRWCSQDLPY